MSPRKKKKNKSSLLSLIPFFKTGKTKTSRTTRRKRSAANLSSPLHSIKTALIILCTIFFFSGIVVGFYYLDKYVTAHNAHMGKTVPVQILNKPEWYNDALDTRIYSVLGASRFTLQPDIARRIADKLTAFAWLNNIKVTLKPDCIAVKADFRKPLAKVNTPQGPFYVDENLIVLDYLPVSTLPIITITGFASRSIPSPGRKWFAEDITAAIDIIRLLSKMDAETTPKKPLLNELDHIDVANLDARKTSRRPHIIIYAKDGTPIWWGAAIGRASRYLEAPEIEKLARLYRFYKVHGTVQSTAKYIELRYPESIPAPTVPQLNN